MLHLCYAIHVGSNKTLFMEKVPIFFHRLKLPFFFLLIDEDNNFNILSIFRKQFLSKKIKNKKESETIFF